MINYIWFGMIAIGILVGICTGNVQEITDAAINNAKTGFELALGLTGIMALWLGLMNVAEEAGLVKKISGALKPVLTRLFPDVPPEHPAMGAMLMNISANVLGLGDAATPFGIKAMSELQKLNESSDAATDSMCMFLAINTSSITLVPATIIAYRIAAGSTNAMTILAPTLVATSCSTFVAIVASKLLAKTKKSRSTKTESDATQKEHTQ
jgi:spore maturation protein A